MNKLLTAIAFSIMTAGAVTAIAQPPGGGPGNPAGGPPDYEERIERRVDRMATQLNLTAEQKAQIQAIMEEQHAKHQALWQESQTRINAVLDEQQRAEFEQMKAQRGFGHHRGGRSGWGGGPGPGNGPCGDGPGPSF
jgi:Spy/CpxP family protein refolding chaperone